MVLKTATIIYSQVLLVVGSSLDVEINEIPERGLHWGTRESNFVVSSVKRPKSIAAPSKLFRKSKATQQDE